jgi:tRNA (cmo5U34)-methyltransferase
MLVRLVDYLPERAERVLELGCGTGNLSLALMTRYPAASITFVDASPEMLDATRQRIGDNRHNFVACYFEDLTPSVGTFDLVVSSISLHHVSDKRGLYQRIAALLDRGGALRFSDQMRGGTDENHALNWQRWLEFCCQPGHCTEDEVESLLEHAAAHDHYTPLEEHFELLREAGFRNLDCVWRNWIWGIVTAERS